VKVAVTGAHGFVGRHVLARLAARPGLQIVTASRSARPTSAVADWPHVQLDVAAPSADDYDRLGRPDALIHLAWAGLPNYLSLHHFASHLGEQYRFLAGLVRAGLPSLLCTGTCFEYGMQSGELREGQPTDPTNPYGHAKDALRRQLEFLAATAPFQLSWCRLFYMYGDGQPASSLYTQLQAAAQRGDASFRMSGGEQLRDFLPVTAVAEYLAELGTRPGGAGVVNVCSGRPAAVRSLVEGWLLQRGWSMALELGHYPYPTYEPMAFWGSSQRLLSLAGPPLSPHRIEPAKESP